MQLWPRQGQQKAKRKIQPPRDQDKNDFRAQGIGKYKRSGAGRKVKKSSTVMYSTIQGSTFGFTDSKIE